MPAVVDPVVKGAKDEGFVLVAIGLLAPPRWVAVRQRRGHAWPKVTGVVVARRLRQEPNGYYPGHRVHSALISFLASAVFAAFIGAAVWVLFLS